MFDLNLLVRKNIKHLSPYSTARDDFKGAAEVFLDANENSNPSAYNRYPDPHQAKLKGTIASLKSILPDQIVLGNGSDEIIDLLIRAFCEPGVDNVIIPQPTYGMYRVWAQVNSVEAREPNLTDEFALDIQKVMLAIDHNSKLLFLCSPNNPSGNLLHKDSIESLLQSFSGIVVVDEAYIDFCPSPSLTELLDQYPNLIILQTLSKAWGLAGIRLGIGIASKQIVAILSKIKAPYNISAATQEIALQYLAQNNIRNQVSTITAERRKLEEALSRLSIVQQVFSSQANFLLVRFTDAKKCYSYLLERKIIVRDRSSLVHCNNCLRITIGTVGENQKLLNALKTYEESTIY
ncbi:MAG: histidinol-phosphate transaminase [Cyclobacteriaceae bacterium]